MKSSPTSVKIQKVKPITATIASIKEFVTTKMAILVARNIVKRRATSVMSARIIMEKENVRILNMKGNAARRIL